MQAKRSRKVLPRLPRHPALRRHAIGRAIGVLAAASGVLVASPAFAAPEGGTVSAGQAQIGRIGNVTAIVQQSNRAVIDWRSFSVASSEIVDFRQPGATSVTLNRVTGNDPSAIFGRISANGTVYLVNQNGILFGSSAQVNVGGLVASTANISNANFMAGNDRFDQPGQATASVRNEGTIRIADNGIAALVGRSVSNSGFIVARLGKVALSGGDAFVLDLTGDRLVSLILDPTVLERIADAQGNPLIARVDNTGNIQAAGGRVELTADTVSRLLDNVINVGGDIRAAAVEARDGVIRITGGSTTNVLVNGVLQAGGAGAVTSIAGRDITLEAGATLATTARVDLSAGSDLQLQAARRIVVDAPINALVTGGVTGGTLTAVAAGNIDVNATVALNNGALSLTSTGGRISAVDGALLYGGDQAVTLRGQTGVAVQNVLTSGVTTIASDAGAVTVRGSVAAASAEGAPAAPAAGITITGRDGITVNGLRASGAVTLLSTQGSITFGGAVDAGGKVSACAGVNLSLSVCTNPPEPPEPISHVTAGRITVGAGGIRSSGAGSGISLLAGGDIQLNGALVATAATIAVRSVGGAIAAQVSRAGDNPVDGDAVLHAGDDEAHSFVRVRASGRVTLGGIVAQQGVSITSETEHVLLLSPLGGLTTGYDTYDLGYQRALRPDVGTLTVSAAGSVELNGLNLDGLADPRASGNGLSVVAGGFILSNATIAVNKGGILLQGGETGTDGVYLGASVYSRGWDNAPANSARERLGYGITISGRNLGVFDNSIETAEVPGLTRVTLTQPFRGEGQVYTDFQGYVTDVNGQRLPRDANGNLLRVWHRFRDFDHPELLPEVVRVAAVGDTDEQVLFGVPIGRIVAKVEIANNAANYRLGDGRDPRLVPLTPGGAVPQINVTTTFIGSVVLNVPTVGGDEHRVGRQSVVGFRPTLGALSAGEARVPGATGDAVSSQRGIVIKLLGFEGSGDSRTEVWNDLLSTIREVSSVEEASRNGIVIAGAPFFDALSGFVVPRDGFVLTSTVTQAGTFSAGGGRLRVGIQGNFRVGGTGPALVNAPDCSVRLCFAVLEFELVALTGRESQFVTLTNVVVEGIASTRWESIPMPRPDPCGSTCPGLNRAVHVGMQGGLFFNTDDGIPPDGVTRITDPGRAQAVRVSGSLVGGAGSFSGNVANFNVISPSALLVEAAPSRQQQVAVGGGLQVNSLLNTTIYSFGRVSVDTSAVPRAFDDTVQGTRVALFDGALANGLRPSRTDTFGGGQNIPGFSGIGGANSSATSFNSIPGNIGSVGGTPNQTVAGLDGPRSVPPDIGPTPTGLASDRAGLDAMQSVGTSAEAGGSGITLQIGTSPGRQADLGRSGGLAGAATNIFRRTYRVATSADGSVCSPGAIQPQQSAAAPREGAQPAAQPSSGRDCKDAEPARR